MTPVMAPARSERAEAETHRLERYQLTVCSQPKLVWFRNAKVGTRSLYNLLRESPVEFEIEHEHDVPFDAERYKAHYKFAMVRNPWDRLVSGWKNKIYRKDKAVLRLTNTQMDVFQDFGAFAKYIASIDGETCNVHFRHQSALISLNEVDYVARFERYDDEVRRLFSTLGLKRPETIPHRNRTGHRKPYQDYYTAATRDLVGRFYEKDVSAFGYRFDET